MKPYKIQNHVTKDELIALCQFDHVLQSFGIDETLIDATNCPDWELLDDTASIAIKRNHMPCCPGLCGDIFFIFGQCPEEAFVFIKLHDGTWKDLTQN